MAEELYTFRVDLAVVESLGINLYSNAAAVLSELVANAWDAEANKVDIKWSVAGDSITIEDDGSGMTLQQLNDRYLTVAYKKRNGPEGESSPNLGRPYMGRKGIGKLSVFSLASEVTVFSARDSQRNGFKITVDRLRASIEAKTPYHPEVVPVPADVPAKGTRIVLTKLNRKRTGVSVVALRRRLARRFDTLGFEPEDENRFIIQVDGSPVTYADREDLRRLEYIWQLGTAEIPEAQLPGVKRKWLVKDNVVDAAKGWKLEGWFGTVKRPDQLNDSEDEHESLRNIIILARKRPIQEGILDQLDFNKIFGNYVTGQIRAEFLDLDGSDDIATSDRQRLIEDDERVRMLTKKLRELFNSASDQWSAERPKQKFIELTEKYPVVRQWVEKVPAAQKDAAKQIVSTVAALELNDEAQRPALYKSSILAFERMALESSTKELAQFAEGLFAVDVLPLLANVRSYEDALYIQILRSRLEAIETLGEMINKDELEKVLQKHLFDNMWLLDPSWEGATGDAEMEIALSRIRQGLLFSKTETENQKQGRIDIQYRSAAGVHMIVELKKYGRKTKLDELRKQGEKYHEALREVLAKQSQPVRNISVIFVLGQLPDAGYLGDRSLEDVVDGQLEHIGGRVLYYDELLHTAQKRYKDYRDRRQEVTELDKVLAALDQEEGAVAASEVISNATDSSSTSDTSDAEDQGENPDEVEALIPSLVPVD